jgi:acyl-CoA thioester hydrolase
VTTVPDAPDRLPGLRPRAKGASAIAGLCVIPHPLPFVCDIRIEPHQISGVVDHVSNIEYVRWLDRAAELHADSLGYTRRAMLDRGLMWFVARHEIDYLAEVGPRDELIIATWVRDMRKVKSWRDYIVARQADETIVCRAATLWVLVDLESRRPKRIPPDMIERFAPLHPSPATA